jgi:cold-inducible RNA-binding protein
MSNKLFVGGLSWGTDDDSLRAAFESFGTITDVKVITDRETGRSRGFGFVTFDSNDSAAAAIAALDGTQIDGRAVRVNEAQARTGGGGGGGGRGRDGGNRW